MKYRVIGSNRDTGARMVLEMQADSKAEAERKALQANMSVTRVEDAAVPRDDFGGPRPVSRRRSGGFGWLIQLIILLIIVGVVWHFWPAISAMLFKK